MTAHTSERTVDTRRDEAATDRWVVLQRSVAGGMLATFAFVMLVVAQELIPPLLVAGALFAVPLATSAPRPRGSAVAIGVLAAIWLAFQVANASRVVPDLADPATTGPFITAVAMVAIAAAGVVGLVGLLRRASDAIATRVLQGTATIVALGVVGSLATAAVVGDEPVTVSDGPATVTLRDIEFQPANLQVTTGTTVTWAWADGGIEHDVVATRFASDLKTEGTFTHTFEAPGTYAYRCSVHPGMTGTVTVVAGGDDQEGGR